MRYQLFDCLYERGYGVTHARRSEVGSWKSINHGPNTSRRLVATMYPSVSNPPPLSSQSATPIAQYAAGYVIHELSMLGI